MLFGVEARERSSVKVLSGECGKKLKAHSHYTCQGTDDAVRGSNIQQSKVAHV